MTAKATTKANPRKTTRAAKRTPDAIYTEELAELLSGNVHVLIGQRTCKKDGRAHSAYAPDDFRWPQRGWVACSDWSARQVCGYGLHFAAVSAIGGETVYDAGSTIVDNEPDLRWQVVIAMAGEAVRVEGNKHKAPRVFVVDLDGSKEAMSAWLAVRGIVGHHMTATAGYGGTATAGYGGTATAGYGGTATAGDHGTATAGFGGTATAGLGGTATAGDHGTATAGDHGTATAGFGGTATAKNHSRVKTGENGIVVTTWFDRNDAKQVKAWTVGEGRDLVANTLYEIVDGVSTEVKS